MANHHNCSIQLRRRRNFSNVAPVNFGPIQLTIDRPLNISFCSEPFFFPCATRFPATTFGGNAALPQGLDSFSLNSNPSFDSNPPFLPFPIPALFDGGDTPSFGLFLVADDTNINIHYELNTRFNTNTVRINNNSVFWGSDGPDICTCDYVGHWRVAVPEPSTLPILLTALAFLGFGGWHARRRTTHDRRLKSIL